MSEEVKKLERLLKKAAKVCPDGEWQCRPSNYGDEWGVYIPSSDSSIYPIALECYQGDNGKEVAKLICGIRNHAPAILSRLALAEELMGEVKQFSDSGDCGRALEIVCQRWEADQCKYIS